MEFEWDKQKAKLNLSKHGISFEEAQTVFDDPLYVDFYDPDHSLTLQRLKHVGFLVHRVNLSKPIARLK